MYIWLRNVGNDPSGTPGVALNTKRNNPVPQPAAIKT